MAHQRTPSVRLFRNRLRHYFRKISFSSTYNEAERELLTPEPNNAIPTALAVEKHTVEITLGKVASAVDTDLIELFVHHLYPQTAEQTFSAKIIVEYCSVLSPEHCLALQRKLKQKTKLDPLEQRLLLALNKRGHAALNNPAFQIVFRTSEQADPQFLLLEVSPEIDTFPTQTQVLSGALFRLKDLCPKAPTSPRGKRRANSRPRLNNVLSQFKTYVDVSLENTISSDHPDASAMTLARVKTLHHAIATTVNSDYLPTEHMIDNAKLALAKHLRYVQPVASLRAFSDSPEANYYYSQPFKTAFANFNHIPTHQMQSIFLHFSRTLNFSRPIRESIGTTPQHIATNALHDMIKPANLSGIKKLYQAVLAVLPDDLLCQLLSSLQEIDDTDTSLVKQAKCYIFQFQYEVANEILKRDWLPQETFKMAKNHKVLIARYPPSYRDVRADAHSRIHFIETASVLSLKSSEATGSPPPPGDYALLQPTSPRRA